MKIPFFLFLLGTFASQLFAAEAPLNHEQRCRYFFEASQTKKLINTAHFLTEMGLDTESFIGKVALGTVDHVVFPILKYEALKDTWRQSLEMSAKNGIDPAVNMLQILNVQEKVDGNKSEWPQDSGIVIVSNHPTGPLDGALIRKISSELSGDSNRSKIMATTMTQGYLGTDPQSIFVNTKANEEAPAKNEKAKKAIEEAKRLNLRAMKETLDHLKKKGILLLFPAGRIAKLSDQNRPEDFPWTENFVNLARKTKSKILTLRIEGFMNKKSWYNSPLRSADYYEATLGRKDSTPTVTVGDLIDLNAEPWAQMSDKDIANTLYRFSNNKE